MTGLLLQYNKVHNISLQNLATKLNKEFNIEWGDLTELTGVTDIQSAPTIAEYFSSLPHFDFVIIGDAFWPTGQNICKVCKERNIPTFFLQHRQWIYEKIR